MIIPRGGDNHVAIDMLVKHVKARLRERRRTSPLGRVLPPYRPPAGETAPPVNLPAMAIPVPGGRAAAAAAAALLEDSSSQLLSDSDISRSDADDIVTA